MLKEKIMNWEAEVRDYELDFQGIVNNACYFNYFDQARAKYFDSLGIDIETCARQKINIVLLKTEIEFKKSLRYKDVFLITSSFERMSKLRFCFKQKIYLKHNHELIAVAESVITCIEIETKKVVVIPKLDDLFERH